MEKTTPSFSKIDESFRESNSPDYDLVLQITDRSCEYSIFDHANNKFIALESYGVPLPSVIDRNHWLKNSFRSVRIIVENNRSTLIPFALFEEAEKDTYLNFSVETENDEKVLFDRLTQLDIVNIFGVNNTLHNQIVGLFPGAMVCHVSSVLIESIWMNFKNLITDKQILIFVREEAFNMIIFEKKQLVYSNAFNFREPEDFIYYVIFVMEQLNLNPEEVPVTLLGKISTKTPYFDFIFKYIRNVDFALQNESTEYSYVFDDVPGHSFYTLLNPMPCGS
jgi:phosphoribosyl-ATP pyrophosphohydrolase